MMRAMPLEAPDTKARAALRASLLTVCGAILYVVALFVWFTDDRKHALLRIGIPWLIVLVSAVISFPSSIHIPLAAWFDRFRTPSPTSRRFVTLFVWLTTTAYLAATAFRQHRDFNFRVQDEMMYLVQTQMLARGHLYMPAHPMAEFFQTFYIFTRPVYASMYFPGAAMMFTPAAWLHLPPWITPLLICGGVAAMTYRVTTELVDGVFGLLAALLVIALPTFRTLSLLTLSYMPMALLGLLLVWAYLHWRRQRGIGLAAAMGILAGWAAITRPLDAVCFALPVAIGVLMDLRGESIKRWMATLLISVLCAMPFISMQLVIDRAVTGSALRTPVQKYEELYWPGAVFGLHPHLAPGKHALATSLPQFRDNYEHFVLPHFTGDRKNPHPLRQTLEWALPQSILLIPLPVGLLRLRGRRWVLWCVLAFFPLAYATWVMFLPYYAAVVAPVLAFAVVLGAKELIESFPAHRAARSSFLTLSIALLAIASLPEFNRKDDKTSSSPAMQRFNELAATIRKPAVVFFRYPANDPMAWRHEQTYNIDAADIDEQPIVRAQDLGDRNIELMRYYQAKQPGRTFYRFDQGTRELAELPP
jgi:hypothetical protein